MPLKVKPFRQRREHVCLPAGLRTVCAFFDERLSDNEASELCDEVSPLIEPRGGCDWNGAVTMLVANYPTLQVVTEGSESLDEAWEKLRHCIEEPKFPVIVPL